MQQAAASCRDQKVDKAAARRRGEGGTRRQQLVDQRDKGRVAQERRHPRRWDALSWVGRPIATPAPDLHAARAGPCTASRIVDGRVGGGGGGGVLPRASSRWSRVEPCRWAGHCAELNIIICGSQTGHLS